MVKLFVLIVGNGLLNQTKLIKEKQMLTKKVKKNTDKNRVEMGRKDHSFLREIDQIKAELYQICKCQKHSKLRSCGGHQSIPPFPVFLLLYFESQDMTSLNCISQYTLPIDFWLG